MGSRGDPRSAWLGRCLLILALVLTVACTEPARDALRFGLADAPHVLDPRFATDATSMRINRLLYAALVDFDARGMPVPDLAAWRRLAPTHYRFTLGAEGRRFHDGTRLSAHDVKATYDFILAAGNASPHRLAIGPIRAIEVLDEDTLDFHLSRPDALFPAYLTIGILPARLAAAGQGALERPVGSGPFAFLERPGEGRLRLVRRTDGQVFEFVQVRDPTVRVLKLLRGEIDMLQNDLPPELVAYLARQEGVRVERAHGSNFTYLGFNLQDPVTGRLEVRRAIAHAIDRAGIIRHVFAGGAHAAQALFPPDHWLGNAALADYAYAPARARALLAQAGYDEEHPVRLIYKTSSDPFRVRLATIVQRQLAEVGIRVQVQSLDWATYYGDIKAGRFQLYSLAWVGIKTPDIFRYAFHSTALPPTGANRGRLVSPRVDRLIEAAEGAVDLQGQGDYYRRLQAVLLEELPYVPLWYEDQIFAARQDIAGYALRRDGNYDGLRTLHRRAPP